MKKICATLIAAAILGTSYNPKESHVEDLELAVRETLRKPTNTWRGENTTVYYQKFFDKDISILFADSPPLIIKTPENPVGKEDWVKIRLFGKKYFFAGKEPVLGYQVYGDSLALLPIQETRIWSGEALSEIRQIIESGKQRTYAEK